MKGQFPADNTNPGNVAGIYKKMECRARVIVAAVISGPHRLP